MKWISPALGVVFFLFLNHTVAAVVQFNPLQKKVHTEQGHRPIRQSKKLSKKRLKIQKHNRKVRQRRLAKKAKRTANPPAFKRPITWILLAILCFLIAAFLLYLSSLAVGAFAGLSELAWGITIGLVGIVCLIVALFVHAFRTTGNPNPPEKKDHY